MTRSIQNTAVNLFASLAAACLVVSLSASLASAAFYSSIGVNFVGNAGTDGTLAAGDSAGVVPRTNWNNVTGVSGTSIGLNNGTGVSSGASLTFSAQGLYSVQNGGATTNQPGDEALNAGFIYGNGTATISGLDPVGFAKYDVFVYQLNDSNSPPRQETTTLTTAANVSTSYYGSSPNPSDPGYVDNNPSTPYNYVQATSTTAGTYTLGANYVEFTNVTGTSFTINTSAPSNGYLSGIQIVSLTPEPSSFILCGLGAAGLFLAARRRRRA